MTDVAEFLTARWDELEALARAATPGGWWNELGTVHAPGWWEDAAPGSACHPLNAQNQNGVDNDADAEHAAAHDPAYVLADLTAKRQILAMHEQDGGSCVEDEMYGQLDPWPCKTVALLAAPFADHPDFDPAWVVT